MRRRPVLLIVFALWLPTPLPAYDARSMVYSSPGTLPLLLTVPHDGDQTLGSVAVRRGGVRVRDLGTRALAESTAAILQERTGKRPYLVIARFSRKYLDANRSPGKAMESEDALPAYNEYHGQIAAFVAELKARYPQGALLLDLHGQSHAVDTIYRGTRAGLTVTALLRRHGPGAIHGVRSITGALAARGYRINPAAGAEPLSEYRRYAGGYTVFHHGSQHPNGIDALQLEFGRNLRASPGLAADLAQAVLVFMNEYLLTRR